MQVGQLINVTVWVAGIIPALCALAWIYRNRGEPWRVSNFIGSCVLFAVSALMIGLLTDLISIAEELRKNGTIDASVFSQLRSSGAIWLVMFPAVFGGVGVNVLSEYLLARKPQQAVEPDRREDAAPG